MGWPHLLPPSLWTNGYVRHVFLTVMADLQQGERKHVMFLRVSAGNWDNGSSIQVPLAKAGHLARAGTVTLPTEEETHTMENGREVRFLIQGGKKEVGTVAQLVILGVEILARVSRRAMNKMIRLAERYADVNSHHFQESWAVQHCLHRSWSHLVTWASKLGSLFSEIHTTFNELLLPWWLRW